jgi:hypothetical protein
MEARVVKGAEGSDPRDTDRVNKRNLKSGRPTASAPDVSGAAESRAGVPAGACGGTPKDMEARKKKTTEQLDFLIYDIGLNNILRILVNHIEQNGIKDTELDEHIRKKSIESRSALLNLISKIEGFQVIALTNCSDVESNRGRPTGQERCLKRL